MSGPHSEFTTTRDELWNALVAALPSGFVETEGEYGPGREYYILCRDLFPAIRSFCDQKEAGQR